MWTAGFGMYLLGRHLGLRLGGALMAGLVYGLNLWLVSWLSYPHAGVGRSCPWLLWLTSRLVSHRDATSVALAAAAIGLQFLAGHPESSFHLLLAAAAFFVLRLGLAPEGPGRGCVARWSRWGPRWPRGRAWPP